MSWNMYHLEMRTKELDSVSRIGGDVLRVSTFLSSCHTCRHEAFRTLFHEVSDVVTSHLPHTLIAVWHGFWIAYIRTLTTVW